MGDNDTAACREGAKALTLEEAAPMARAKGMTICFMFLFLGLFAIKSVGISERGGIDWIFFSLTYVWNDEPPTSLLALWHRNSSLTCL